MRVTVLCERPDAARDDPGSVACILDELGCPVTVGRFDLGDLQLADLQRFPPNIVVVEAIDAVDHANRCRTLLGGIDCLVDVPVLLVVAVPRLPGVDFSMGFDDFILHPVVPAELYARLRQLDWKTATFGSDEVIKIAELVIDLAGYEVHLQGRKIALTHQEFELLRFLAQNRGRVYSRDQLLQRVWGYDYAGGTRTVDIHVRRIRAKLGSAAALIVTVRNVGYKMHVAELGDDD